MSRVVVIGGGLAGITAALDLAEAGAQVTLLESRGRLGGAAYSFTRDGLTVDNGQHVFLRCCTDYLALLERIGARALVSLQDRLSIPVLAPGGAVGWLQRDAVPSPLHLARSLLRYPFLSPVEKASAAVAMSALSRVDPTDPAVDGRSFADWLAAHRQSPNAVGVLWELVATPTLNLRASDASLAQAAYVFQQGLLAGPGDGDIGWATAPLGELHDDRARAALDAAGVLVRTRAGATSLTRGAGEFRVGVSRAAEILADGVVLAVPPRRATSLVPGGAGVDVDALRALGTSPIVNLHLVLDRPVLAAPFAATVRSPVQWVFDRTHGAGLQRGQYLAVSLSAADAELGMSAGELRERFVPALAEVLPELRSAQVENFFVTREHAATFRAAPGQLRLRPGAGTAIPSLVLAGAWTATGWPATMEGAVRSGHAAAEALRPALPATSARGEAVAA